MHDLNLFRALEQSRKVIEEEFVPSLPPRLAGEVGETTPKRLRAKVVLQSMLSGKGQRAKGFSS
jgi:hypothetical protein